MVQYVFIKRNTELARIFGLDVMKKNRKRDQISAWFFGVFFVRK